MATVLIIDDDEDIREALSAALQLENFRTLEAPHGDYGLRLLEKYPVDVIVTDIFMPEKEGLETIVDAKQRWPNVKIVAISGGPGATRRMGSSGGHDFLPVAQDLGADRVMKKAVPAQRTNSGHSRVGGRANLIPSFEGIMGEYFEVSPAMIADGLSRNQFFYVYQPKTSFATGDVVGAEALIRWRREDRIVPPGDFIPIAEAAGLSPVLFTGMLERFLDDVNYFRDAGIRMPISINLSPTDLRTEEPARQLHEIVKSGQLEGADVQIEITESTVLMDDEKVRNSIKQMLDDGVKLLMDDFGTGFSSIDVLSKFPFAYVKLDRGLISRMAVSLKNYRIVKGIVHLTQDLSIDTVAEGVESRGDYQTLQMLGCTEAQGFYISPGIEIDAFIHFANGTHDRPRTDISALFGLQGTLTSYRRSIVATVMCNFGVSEGDGEIAAMEQEIEHDPRKSRFGRWYYGDESADLASYKAFQDIELPHSRMRELGLDILHRTKRGDTSFVEIMTLLQEFNACGNEVDQSLAALIETYLLQVTATQYRERRYSG